MMAAVDNVVDMRDSCGCCCCSHCSHVGLRLNLGGNVIDLMMTTTMLNQSEMT